VPVPVLHMRSGLGWLLATQTVFALGTTDTTGDFPYMTWFHTVTTSSTLCGLHPSSLALHRVHILCLHAKIRPGSQVG
jgi:hypothetical protein